MAFDFKGLIEPLARHFLGEPNRHRSTANELRYGSNGSVSVDKDKDTFFNHEGGYGGGVVEFVRWQARTDDPMQWLKDRYPDRCDEKPNGAHRSAPLGRIVATYDYRDEGGVVLSQVVKYDPKDYRQRVEDRSQPSGWTWKVRGIRQVPYRLPELIQAIAAKQLIFVVEGEKDVETLRSHGCNATSNVGGAGKWRNDLSSYFNGAIEVVVIADNDPQAIDKQTGELLWHPDGRPKLPGQDHAHDVCKSLKPIVAKVRYLDLGKHWPECPSKGDITNWFEQSKTLEQLFAIIGTLPEWQPERSATVEPLLSAAATSGPVPARDAPLSLSDDDLAESFKAKRGEDFAYMPVAKQWRSWDGTRWIDSTSVDLEATLGEFLRGDVRPHVKKAKDKLVLGSQGKISAIASRLRALLRVNDRAFDADPWLLNTPGGTISLRWTGGINSFALRKHDRGDHITKSTATAPGPGGSCPKWIEFIEFVSNGDQELGAYLQKLAGYALAGVSDEQMFAFLYGSGNNGKSVFLQTLLHVLGDYAVTVNSEVFLWSAIPRHSEELMPMRGARLVFASEVPKDARWNEGRLKNLTGGERTRARGMHSNSVEFDIEATLIISGNDKPHLKGVDIGIARRLHLVPFVAIVGEDMRDKRKLDQLKGEAPGILAWALEGCHKWQTEGLERPGVVQAATEQYIEDEDSIRQWLDECIDTNTGAIARSTPLFKSWRAWADDHGIKPGNVNSLSARLVAMGYAKERDRSGAFFRNLTVRPTDASFWPER